jgi:hypothetical protein
MTAAPTNYFNKNNFGRLGGGISGSTPTVPNPVKTIPQMATYNGPGGYIPVLSGAGKAAKPIVLSSGPFLGKVFNGGFG